MRMRSLGVFLGVLLVLPAPNAIAQSFDWMSVTSAGSDKCDSQAAIVVLSRTIAARCSSPDGECSGELRIPLLVSSGVCRPRGKVAFEHAAAYITAWYQWSVNWEQAPEEWVEQIHHLSYALSGQRVEHPPTGPELVIDLKYRFNAAGAPEYFSPEHRDLLIGIEVVAVDPSYSVFVSVEPFSHGVSGPGPSAGGLKALTTNSGLTLAYLGLAAFTYRRSRASPQEEARRASISRVSSSSRRLL
ncbi:MAG: hypothetical protein IT380_04380 [Myxococcales bacterium]|nr:hypothetical protein [Myxococcales bacterium]